MNTVISSGFSVYLKEHYEFLSQSLIKNSTKFLPHSVDKVGCQWTK